ncbi:MAG TPA: hypothetical protein VFD90_12325 [Gaiellales bacterium]|nr:hypothetical protein [Gaiellales bacterium]
MGAEAGWPLANHDLSSTRSASASGIDRASVASLRVASRFRRRTPPGQVPQRYPHGMASIVAT